MVSMLGDIGEHYVLYRYCERVVELLRENIEYQKISLQVAKAKVVNIKVKKSAPEENFKLHLLVEIVA